MLTRPAPKETIAAEAEVEAAAVEAREEADKAGAILAEMVQAEEDLAEEDAKPYNSYDYYLRYLFEKLFYPFHLIFDGYKVSEKGAFFIVIEILVTKSNK